MTSSGHQCYPTQKTSTKILNWYANGKKLTANGNLIVQNNGTKRTWQKQAAISQSHLTNFHGPNGLPTNGKEDDSKVLKWSMSHTYLFHCFTRVRSRLTM